MKFCAVQYQKLLEKYLNSVCFFRTTSLNTVSIQRVGFSSIFLLIAIMAITTWYLQTQIYAIESITMPKTTSDTFLVNLAESEGVKFCQSFVELTLVQTNSPYPSFYCRMPTLRDFDYRDPNCKNLVNDKEDVDYNTQQVCSFQYYYNNAYYNVETFNVVFIRFKFILYDVLLAAKIAALANVCFVNLVVFVIIRCRKDSSGPLADGENL